MDTPRRFHLCLSPDIIARAPGLLITVRNAGITDIWTTGFLYGHWYYPPVSVQAALRAIAAAGLAGHVANVPLGHPGDSLGSTSADVPLGPPPHWRMGARPDGSLHSGTSLHPPAVEENCQALQTLQGLGVDKVMLDDDYRLAEAPGTIGGCFCAEHQQRFTQRFGLAPQDWAALLQEIRERRFTPRLRQWVDFTCDELTDAFRRQRAAAPAVELGNMVMYLGAEKAGIRLADYAGVPLRVGELMFNDASFAPVKGKTDELFSVLFHRRFVRPELAYSETTAFPADQLSAKNLAAKLNISLIADVRNTMFMSGLTPFPAQHWATLSPAIQRQAALHPRVAGAQLHGPLKHYWGPASRYTGDDNPFSLFLAMGVPFEVVDQPPPAGWVFLSQADAQDLPAITRAGAQFVVRKGPKSLPARVQAVEESLPALFEFKHRVLEPHLQKVPYVVEDLPVVCAWYPAVGRVLLWNLSEVARSVTLRVMGRDRRTRLEALGVEICEISNG